MSFQAMKQYLDRAYSNNVQFTRMQQLINDGHDIIGNHSSQKRSIPVLSGPTGIGKTTCVRAFATEKEFEFIELDCAYLPSSALAAYLYSAISRILTEQINGCVLLIDNINEADSEWLDLFDQYAKNYFDATVNIAEQDGQNNEVSQTQVQFNEIPEGLFLVGEQQLI